jgi:ATP-dependent helicase/nuclease subunit B
MLDPDGASSAAPGREPGSDLRRFLGWDRPALPLAAELLAEHYREGDAIDMGAATLVLPGGRAGRRLKELLVQEAAARGARLLPPRITTAGQLPELLYGSELPLAGDALRLRVWARSLSGMTPEARAALFTAPPAPDDLRGWSVLAAIVGRLSREIGAAGLGFGDVAERCEGGLLWDDGDRWRALAEVQVAYGSELGRLGYVDPDRARADALILPVEETDADVWLLGVPELPLVTRRLLERFAAAGGAVAALVHAPASESDAFDELGCVRAEAWLHREIRIPEDRLRVRPRPADVADEVASLLAALGGRYGPDEIVLAVPDPELEPYLSQRLATGGIATRSAEGTPVERSAPFRLLEAVSEVVDRRFEAYAALARHPDLAAWATGRTDERTGARTLPPDWLLALDDYFCVHLPDRVDGGPSRPDVSSAAPFRAFRELVESRLLIGLRGRRPLSGWADAAVALLLEVYGDRELDGSPRAQHLADAAQRIANAARELALLPDAVDEECSSSDGLRILLDACAAAEVAPEPRRDAIELLGWLEMHLDDTPAGIVTGFNEPAIPESLNADAFLPNALRTRLGLTDNDGRYARYAYQLTAMLASREHLWLIAARRTASGDPLRPSRLMFALRGPELARRVERFYGDVGTAQAGGPGRSPAVHSSAPEPSPRGRVSGFRLPPEPVIVRPGGPATIAVTAFAALLGDPYRYALERVLRLGSVDDEAREMDGGAFGALAHRVLERFGSDPARASEEPREVRDALHRLLDAAVAERFGSGAHPAVHVQTEQLRARLGAFAEWQASRVAEGWTIVGVECRTSPTGVPFEVDGVPIGLTGRIDRIDFHPATGRWEVLDFKTGDRARSPQDTHRKGRGTEARWTDLQLPLYRRLIHSVADRHGEAVAADADPASVAYGYLLLPKELDRTGPSMADWDAALLDTADDAAREIVRLLRRGEYRFDDSAAGWFDDPFAALLGRGHLGGDDDEDGEVER